MRVQEALNQAIRHEMAHDQNVLLIGEDVGEFGGVYGVTRGLLDEFGSDRVIDTPISEAAMMGMGIGAAMSGLRPIVEIMYMDFLLVCADQIVNQAAKMHYMSDGAYKVPLTIRTQSGGWRGGGAQHTQTLESMFAGVPGLRIVAPSSASEARGLLVASIRDDNPVIFVEHRLLYAMDGPVDDTIEPIPLGLARIARPGADVTIVCLSMIVNLALEAADVLAEEGLGAEVVDLRCLSPLDLDTVYASARRTGHVLIVQQGHRSFGWGAELACRIREDVPEARVVNRLGALDVPYPAARHLEDVVLPTTAKIADAVRSALGLAAAP